MATVPAYSVLHQSFGAYNLPKRTSCGSQQRSSKDSTKMINSLRRKLRRSGTGGSSTTEETSPTETSPPQSIRSSVMSDVGGAPLSNASPPTRRPKFSPFDPPPAYTSSPGPSEPVAPASSIGINAHTSTSSGSTPNDSATSRATTVEASNSTSSNVQAPVKDDAFSFLTTFDTALLIDDSGSMAGRSWRESSLALEALVPVITAHDSDGVDVYFLNAPDKPAHHNITEPSVMHGVFNTVRPSSGTPTGQSLNRILKPYLAQCEADLANTKPLNIIVITDGVPSDDLESVIIRAARKLDALDAESWQLGIQMFQVGNEEGASEYLTFLDDELSRMGGGCRDIVDTVPFVTGPNGRGSGLTADVILKVVLGAVNKRLDRRRNSAVIAETR